MLPLFPGNIIRDCQTVGCRSVGSRYEIDTCLAQTTKEKSTKTLYDMSVPVGDGFPKRKQNGSLGSISTPLFVTALVDSQIPFHAMGGRKCSGADAVRDPCMQPLVGTAEGTFTP